MGETHNNGKLTDLSVYFITDNGFGWSHEELMKQVSDSGVKIIQFREKNEPINKCVEIGKKLEKIAEKKDVKLIVNDRVDVAMAIDADGVHLGQDDLPLRDARKILGSDKIIGISVKTVPQAVKAEKNGADYLGVGTIFSTSTKEVTGKSIGLKKLKEISEKVNIPIVGIGGINKNNAIKVIDKGADGIAVISEIANSDSPKKEAEKLLEIVKNN